jgi:hypothetical protein
VSNAEVPASANAVRIILVSSESASFWWTKKVTLNTNF